MTIQEITSMKVMYQCYLKYADGLVKQPNLTQEELDETYNVWQDEMLNTDGDELKVLKIRKTNVTEGNLKK